MKHITHFMFVVLFAFIAGQSLSYLTAIPTTTPEIRALQEFSSKATTVTDNFEEYDKYEKDAMESIDNPARLRQSFFLSVFFVPMTALMFTVGWYFLGLYAQYDSYLKGLKIAVAVSALVYFGYFYQPYLNMIGYILGVFGIFEKFRNRAKQN